LPGGSGSAGPVLFYFLKPSLNTANPRCLAALLVKQIYITPSEFSIKYIKTCSFDRFRAYSDRNRRDGFSSKDKMPATEGYAALDSAGRNV
jgi:hypothetical protein